MHSHDYYGDNFKWFVGVAKDLSADGSKVRVRVFGIHRMDDTTDVSDGDLPYAVVLTPTTGGESMNSGQQIGIQNGDWVMGFFADGDDCMQPVVVGVIGGGTYSDATTSGMGLGGSGPGGGGGDGSGGGVDGGGYVSDSTIPGGGVEHQAYNFLRSRMEQIHGNSDQAHCQACGMMGHMYVESWHWRNIHIVNKGEAAFGICQWRYDRRARLIAMSKPGPPTLSQQLSFVFWEFEHTHKSAYRKMLAARSTQEAVYAFSYFELHAGVTGRGINMAVAKVEADFDTRMNQALAYDRFFKNKYIRPEYGPNRGADQPVTPVPHVPGTDVNDNYNNR